MAMNAHIASRRDMLALFGGTVAAGTIFANAAKAGTAPPLAVQTAGWDKAHADYRKAQQALDDYDRLYLTPAEQRYEACRKAWLNYDDQAKDPQFEAEYAAESARFDDVEGQFNALANQRYDAARAMIKVPAPHASAVADKFEIIISEEYWNCHGFEDVAAQILADLRRLGGN